MGNSTAWPVFRTSDVTTAYAQAKRLRALLARREDEVWFLAELCTVEDVRRMAAVLPGARFEHTGSGMRPGPAGEELWFDLDVTTADDAALQAALPLDATENLPTGSVEDRFVAALGRGTAAMDWHGSWPEEPEAGRYANAKYDGVQVVFHGDDSHLGRWTAHHTVFVHGGGGPGAAARARHLAAHIGGEVLGEPQRGW
ncbi:hypothetical protein ACODT3_01760 [Streptomyces sp. 4.24]|uniref:hypothetical protein n=1 Tax=Streptomyces tritrimontium TaxID=3406573 RepID=UPI003BB50EE5